MGTSSVPFEGLGFFRWVEEDQEYKHNAVTYNGVVKVLGQEESIGEFWSMVKKMASEGHDLDIEAYIKVSRQLQDSNMMKDAVELYELMMDSQYKPPVNSFLVILRNLSIANTPDLSLVFRVVKKFEAMGNTLSKSEYDRIHRTLCNAGEFDKVEKIVETMRSAGFKPDNVTYSQLVFGLSKAKKLKEACKVLDEMEARGCVPNIVTWSYIIQGLLKAGEFDTALTSLKMMKVKECAADANLLGVLVHSLCSNERAKAAYTLFVEMVEKDDIKPQQTTYKHLIEILVGEGKLKEAFKLLTLMKDGSFPVFTKPFVSFISKRGTAKDACELLKVIRFTKFPPFIIYFQVVESFVKEGRRFEAKDFLYKCPIYIRKSNDILRLLRVPKTDNLAAAS
ncbi:hypothetical protein GIB67_030917 [Kingdonia uniflora]|uniref:Pentatricopeptide repeat-containing protein n=1 Tax=Kingdonia uniflora TaxID=39325 RepID=A0A7J7L3I4_9MAGN|nr:hypothetical protein GIB67_030917 [Kingdonia uniflora]